MRNLWTNFYDITANKRQTMQFQPVALMQQASKRLIIALFQSHWLHIGQVQGPHLFDGSHAALSH